MPQSPLVALHEAAGAALSDRGGWTVPEAYGALDAGLQAARAGAIVADLSWVDVLDLQAPELRRWANGMFTNNIKRLGSGRGNRNAMCDDRGRVQGLLDLYCLDDQHFIAVLDGVDAGWFEERYRMFLILDDIEVDPRPDDRIVLTVQGPAAASAVEAAGLPAPAVDRAHEAGPDGIRVARRDRFGHGGFDLLVPAAQAAAVWAALTAAGALPVGTQTLDAARVLAGRAQWPEDGTDKSMVHELRYNEDVCAFDKGCYVGQEVINRIDVKGAINKRLTGILLDQPVPVGAEATGEDGKVVGRVTSVAVIGDQTFGLGVLRKTHWEPGAAVTVAGADGPVGGRVAELPFAR